jgi:hypothetical protein
MSTDSGDRLVRTHRDLWRLPTILGVEVRRRRFKPARRITVRGKDHEVTEGTEIVVRLSEPFEIRALGPVLWVGDVPLTTSESDGKTEYRFLAPHPGTLKRGAEIALSWSASGAPRQRSEHRFEPPTE